MNYVHKNGKIIGPFSNEKIIELLEAHTLLINDFIYSDENSSWVQIFNSKIIKLHYKATPPDINPNVENIMSLTDDEVKSLNSMNPKMKTEVKIPKDLMDKEWFILRKNKKYGPFKYLDIIKMLNSSSLFDYDFIWNKDFKSWNKISDLKAFSSYYINQVKTNYLPELGNIFFRRKHKRIKFDSKVFIHDNEKHWTGIGNDLSPGGTSVTISSSFGEVELLPGDIVNIHFKQTRNIPSFNAKAEIVSKWYKNKEFRDSPLCYSFKFNSINKKIEDYLTQICNEDQKAA